MVVKDILNRLPFDASTLPIPETTKSTWMLRAFGLTKVPLLLIANPRVVEVSSNRCEIVIPLNRITRNHLKSMYFGTLAIGADCAGGLIAMHLIQESGENISLVFKDFKANFLKRPEADVVFSCENGPDIAEQVQEAIQTGERVNRTLRITATCPSKLGDEPVAEFDLTLSLKKK